MTTITPFVPPQNGSFQFEPTLGGQTYSVFITWSVFGQRWYINIFSLDGVLILSEALIGSPNGKVLQALSWANGIATATTTASHGYGFMETVRFAVSGCSPDAYNGVVEAFVISDTQFQYPVTINPGAASVLGAVSFDVNIIEDYIEGSTLVYRDGSRNFEVTP